MSGESFGANKNGELYKGMMCFMIIALKSNVPYMIKTVPEQEIKGEWLKDEIVSCVTILREKGFNVRGIVCDDHASNVSAYKKLIDIYGIDEEDLAIEYNSRKIYLFFDAVHLMKNIRNNLLNRKRFLFPLFLFENLSDLVKVPGGDISWQLFHQVFEQDSNLEANIQAAPKWSAEALYLGNCKQSVPVALAIVYPSTSASIKHYFPDKTDSAEFLSLFYYFNLQNSIQFSSSSWQCFSGRR